MKFKAGDKVLVYPTGKDGYIMRELHLIDWESDFILLYKNPEERWHIVATPYSCIIACEPYLYNLEDLL